MPEFCLNMGGAEGAARFATLDEFTRGFLEALFFTETGFPENGDMESATFAEVAPEALRLVARETEYWQRVDWEALREAYARGYTPQQAGRDLWFTQNWHGTGFWDREILRAENLGSRLTNAAGRNAIEMYRGDDGRLCLD